MTVRKIADTLKISPDTVRNAAQRVLPNKVNIAGVPTNYTEDECAKILRELQVNEHVKSHISSDLTTVESRQQLKLSSTVQKVVVSIDKMSKEDLLQTTMYGFHTLLSQLRNENKQLESDNKQLKIQVGLYNNYLSALRVQRMNPTFNAKKGWRKIWQYCKDNNLEIKKIPDDHYGHINAYPLDAWYTVYPELDLPEEE